VKIGELATRSAVSIDAIRYYERRGVLTEADRTSSGYRVFGEADVDRIGLVRQLQELGFTLDEVVEALQAWTHDAGRATCASERWRLEAVADRLDERIHALQRTRRSIRKALAACENGTCSLRSKSRRR
jgi:DNA-binding transcriptional MerR regulator